MATFAEDMQVFHEQLEKGSIQKAYRGMIQFILDLKTYLAKKYPNYSVSGSLYQGYMDMTYFSFTPALLAERKLKVAIVFVYETFRFEAWLAGVNKQVQGEYWQLFRDNGWDKYPLVPSTRGEDAILTCVLVDQPDFDDLQQLTRAIEAGTLQFIADVERFFAELAD